MFSLFKKKKDNYEYPTWSTLPMPDGSPVPAYNLPDPKETPTMPEVEKPADPSMNANAHYTVGINEHGRTQFRMQLDYGSATLTMNDAGTLDLIEDLAHTIRKRYKIEITPIETDDDTEET